MLDDPPITRTQILTDLKKRSAIVRQKWQNQSKIHQEAKYATGLRVLEHIYKQ